MNTTALTGIVSILIGIVYSIQSYQLPKATVGNAWAPIYFPLGLGVLMAIFGVVMLVQGLAKGKANNGEQKQGKMKMTYTAKLIAFTSVVSIIYALLFDRIGYVLSTIFFLGAILFVVNGVKQWKTNMIVSISFALGIYIVFSKFLGIILPKMPFIGF
ncbi:tripartite tricarboxylate transporter TctB family protein [Tepidibacillus infernus]|uniref:tripartite tricarboxylate transporter TctB family protein n=1 Tax=Tepidibacillus TaxID=1494427 RepID=UPI000852986A|nr:tripartite tricarboxylate transporter TctB family protein [Tepidibacillus sp. HK-1]GBF12486.1 tripartite tricarboxylate transporter TctB family protein [Tepidibacillus sp. HK-1]